jgi:hypothetical protein
MSEPEDYRQPSPRPGTAIAEQGAVLLDGPRGAIMTLTPEAAEETGENLRHAAMLAEQQRRAAAGQTGKVVQWPRSTRSKGQDSEPDESGDDPGI